VTILLSIAFWLSGAGCREKDFWLLLFFLTVCFDFVLVGLLLG